jgi:V/A-type H+-transporting ATPase subunit K
MKKRTLMLFLLFPLALLPIVGATVVLTVGPVSPQAQPQPATSGTFDRIAIAVSACLVVSLTGLGAAWAISSAGTAAVSALAEKPETFFRSFLVIALAEALAIYGLIMGILFWLKL